MHFHNIGLRDVERKKKNDWPFESFHNKQQKSCCNELSNFKKFEWMDQEDRSIIRK
jgi:hypothetical protein